MIWLLLMGCGDPGAQREAALAETHAVVAHDYAALATSAETLAADAEVLCASPDAGGLDAARSSWSDARASWKQTQVVGFGPVVEQPDRLGPPIDFGPISGEPVDARVASDQDLSATSFVGFGAGLRGLPAIEYILFGSGDATVDRLSGEPRRCDYLRGATEDLSRNAARLSAAWTEWEDRLVRPDGVPYATRQDVLNEWVNRVLFVGDDIRRDGLPDDADQLQSRFAERSAQDAVDAMIGARQVIEPLLALSTQPDLAPRLLLAMDTAAEQLSELPEPLTETMFVQPELIDRADESVRVVQVLVQTEVAQALSVTVTFNDNDGD